MSDDAIPPKQNRPAPAAKAEDGEYRVGYGRPPKQHRIQPGQRKNPAGRPVGSRNARKVVREEHNRLVSVQEGGRSTRKPAIAVLIRQDVNDALKGNERAKARQIALALQIAAEDEAKVALKSQQETLAEDEAILAHFLNGDPPEGEAS